MTTPNKTLTEDMTFFSKIITPILIALVGLVVTLIVAQGNDVLGFTLMILVNLFSIKIYNDIKKEVSILWMPYYYLFPVLSLLLLLSQLGLI